MTPPFPWSLPPRTARRQTIALLGIFYGLVYGSASLAPIVPHRAVPTILSGLLLGMLMLVAVGVLGRRDVSWRNSLGLGRQRIGSVVGWGLLAFSVTYAANILLTVGYVLLAQGNLQAQAVGRIRWLEHFAEIRPEMILPLTAFVGFWEEIVFRGFLLGRLRAALPAANAPSARLRRDALAVVLCGLCFGAGHGYQGTWGFVQTTVAGVVLGALTVWRGSVWPAIAAHMAIDTFGLLVIKALKRVLDSGAGMVL